MKKLTLILVALITFSMSAQKKKNGVVFDKHPGILLIEEFNKAFVEADVEKLSSIMDDNFKAYNALSSDKDQKGTPKNNFIGQSKWWNANIDYLKITQDKPAYPDAIEYKGDQTWVQTWERVYGVNKQTGVELDMPVHRLYRLNKDATKIVALMDYSDKFVQVNGSDLKLRDLKVFLTNRPEDTQMFNELRQLSQAIIQNGGTLYDVIELYSTKSMRDMKKTFKDLRDRQVQQQQQQMELQQKQQEQAGQIAQAQMQEAARMAQEKQANENLQNELDRVNKKEIAMINAMSKEGGASADLDASGTPDALEIEKLASQQSKAQKDFESKMADINSKNTLAQQKLQIEREKIKLARDNQANDLAVAKENAKGRNKKN